ncbi:MAG: cytochrome c, partial [Pseudolabrys sp.]
ATTTLGVPAGARTVPGCSAPTKAPAYGVTGGYLLYVALPDHGGKARLAEAIGVSDISIRNGFVVLHTAAAGIAEKLCRHHAANTPPADEAKDAAAADHSAARPAGDKDNKGNGGIAALYTKAQALAGQQVFTHICATCHGKDLQGKSGPQIAGAAFLKKAKLLGWSVGNLRSLVVSTMPRSTPGSLKPQQYADVLAYLLAVNCYPAGHNKFPTKTTAALKHTALKPPPNIKPDNGDLGTCAFHPEQKAGLGTSG